MSKKHVLGVIGAGNMASAIVDGIIKAKINNPEEIIISDINENQLALFKQKGISTTISNEELIKKCDNILLAIKPQIFDEIANQLSNIDKTQNIISIMAGKTINSILTAIGKDVPICRIMPNTPAMISKGMSVITCKNFDKKSKILVMAMFSAIGNVIEMDESHFDAVTSVSGSGPAYVYEFISAMIDGGVKGGISYENSRKLALETVIGAAEMVRSNSDKSLDELINAVCSKGGTTIEAINTFRENNLKKIIVKGMDACRTRSKELSSNK